MIKKILSGGQTGVDRAALDVAINLNIQEVKEKNKPYLIIYFPRIQDYNFKDILY